MIKHLRFAWHYLWAKALPDPDHTARYHKPLHVDNGVVVPEGYSIRRDSGGNRKEDDLSVNWVEFFKRPDQIAGKIQRIREAYTEKGYTIKKTGRFSVLEVKEIKERVLAGTKEHRQIVNLKVKHTPDLNDLSHSSILDIPADLDTERLVSAILSQYANQSLLYKGL